MSTLSELLGDVWALLFPPRCPVCGRMMTAGERTVCTHCRAAAPLTGFWREADNPLFRRFWGLLPVERASGFIYYRRGSGWRELIRSFKYRSAWRLAYEMGRWYGRCLRESGLYDDVEVVVPLPLHPFKRMRRGYNQSEYIAEGIARELGVGVDRRSVIRCRNTASQALQPRRERYENVRDAFAVRRPEALAGRHVLLGRRRLHDGQYGHLVRRGDSAGGARLPPERGGARRLAPRAGHPRLTPAATFSATSATSLFRPFLPPEASAARNRVRFSAVTPSRTAPPGKNIRSSVLNSRPESLLLGR